MKWINSDSDVTWWLKMCLITGATIPIVLIISFSVFTLFINLLGLLGIDLKSVLALAW